MIDLASAVAYRGFAVNTVTNRTGCELEFAQFDGVAGVGYTEKRARSDGLDASDVYLGQRRLTLRGTLYGHTRALLFDQLRSFIAAFTPTLAYADDEDAFGYQPLTFSTVTADTSDFPSGTISLFANMRPLAQPTFILNRDTTGGDQGGGISWSVTLEARDPRIYVATATEVALTGATSGSGTIVNRGNYPTPVTVILVSNTATPQDFDFIGCGADVTVSVPDLADGACTITLDGDTRVTTLTYLGNETYRPDLISHTSQRSYPMAEPGNNAYSWSLSAAQLASGSKLRYYEAFA